MENEVATAVVENPYGLGALWEQGDFVAKGTLIIMVIMSLTSWYVILMKFIDQRKLLASAKLAEQKFWTAGSVNEAVDRLPKGDTFRSIAEDGVRARQHHEGRFNERVDLNVCSARCGASTTLSSQSACRVRRASTRSQARSVRRSS